MAITVQDAVAEATAKTKKKPAEQWWTPKGDTGRQSLRNAEVRSRALKRGPDEVIDRHYGQAYRDTHLALVVPDGEGYIYNLTSDPTTEAFYLMVEKRHWKEATPEDMKPPELPKELRGLEGDELKAAIALYHQRVEQGLASLRRHAIKKGMCDTFDKIMQHAGFEGRLNRYRLTLAVEIEKKLTDADGRNYINGFVKFNGEATMVIKVTARFEHDLTAKPKEGTALSELDLDQWELDQVVTAFEGNGHKLTKAQLASVVVSSAQVLTNY